MIAAESAHAPEIVNTEAIAAARTAHVAFDTLAAGVARTKRLRYLIAKGYRS